MADDEETTAPEEEQQDADDDGYEDSSSFGDYDDADDLLDAFADLAEEIESHGKRLTDMLKLGQLDDPSTLAAEMVETVMNFVRDLSQMTYDACVEAIELANEASEPAEEDPGRIAVARLASLGQHLAEKLHVGTEEEKKNAASMLEMLGFDPAQVEATARAGAAATAAATAAEADTAPAPPLSGAEDETQSADDEDSSTADQKSEAEATT